MDREIAGMLAEIMNVMTSLAGGSISHLAEATHAIEGGTATDAQLALVTNVVHTAFDGDDGCMVSTLREMIDKGAPHYFVNHCIRTYVRLADKREQEAVYAAEKRDKEAYKRMSGAPGYGA